MTHIIRQQYLHVEVNGTESDGLALQRSLPDLCQHWLTPAIEQALERCAPPDGHLYIERLEIDAGTLALDRLEHDLSELVAMALEKTIQEHLPSGGGPAATLDNEAVQHKTAQQSLTEAFIYFLRTGSLPWSFRLPEGSSLEQVILDSWREPVQSSSSPHVVNDAVRRAFSSALVRQRLRRQFSPVFLETLLALLAPEGKKVMETILQALRSSTEPLVETKHFEQLLWEMVFANAARGNVLPATSLVGEAWRALSTTTVGDTALASRLEHHWPGVTNIAPAPATRIKHAEPMSTNNAEPIPQDRRVSKEILVGRDEHPEAREGIYIDNAGVVLLHPFLPQFFTALGVAVDDTLVQPERGLCLLHYLTTGQPIAPEYALVLPKILCNIPLETSVECDVELTGAEKEEAVALLEAVIRHWQVLQNTSPDGLRGTFLLRPGKVSLRHDGNWLLQVESNAFDILLDQLPWGIAMIKLPWMNNMLWVEWR